MGSLIFGGAATLLGKLVGPWLKGVMLPALIISLITAVHQVVQARAAEKKAHDAALVAHGRQQCFAEVELASARAEINVERALAAAARAESQSTTTMLDEVRDNARKLDEELAVYRSAAAVADQRCLSDGVLELVRRYGAGQGNGQIPGAGKNSSGNGRGASGKAP